MLLAEQSSMKVKLHQLLFGFRGEHGEICHLVCVLSLSVSVRFSYTSTVKYVYISDVVGYRRSCLLQQCHLLWRG